MTSIESRLAQSLAARAGRGGVEVGELAAMAVTRAGRVRRRRRVMATAVVAVLAVAGAVGVRTLLPERKDTTLPVALGMPSALSRPEDIGGNPALLHLDLDLRAVGAATGAAPGLLIWSSEEDSESVTVHAADGALIAAVYVAPGATELKQAIQTPDPPTADTTVGGRPAKLGTYVVGDLTYADLRWEPVDGIFTAVQARDRATAEKVFAAVRLDRVQRCVTPMRLSALPAGAEWTACQTAIRPGQGPGRAVWVWSTLTIWQANAVRVGLWAQERGTDAAGFKPDRVVTGRPAQWLTDGKRGLWIPDFGPASIHVMEASPFHADLLSEEEAVWYAEHLQLFDDLTNQDAWPTAATR